MTKTNRWALCTVLMLSWGMLASPAGADVIISNLDGNDGLQSADLNELRSKAMGFTMPVGPDYTLTSATLRLETFGSAVAPVVELWTDAGGQLGGLVESLSKPVFADSGIANYDFTSSGSTLSAGASYWVLAYGTAGADQYDWKASSPGVTPTGLATHLGGLFGTSGLPPTGTSSILNSYAINANIVPEPAAGILLLVGLGFVLRMRR